MAAAVLLAVTVASWAGEADTPSPEADATVTPAMAEPFELKDQFRDKHNLLFPAEKVVLLGFGDHHCGGDADAWYRPARERYGDKVQFYGIAALKELPLLWRPLVRLFLRRQSKDPVLLDWKNKVAKSYGFRPREMNLFVIDREGEVVLRLFGKATEEKRAAADKVIEALLAKTGGETPDGKTPVVQSGPGPDSGDEKTS